MTVKSISLPFKRLVGNMPCQGSPKPMALPVVMIYNLTSALKQCCFFLPSPSTDCHPAPKLHPGSFHPPFTKGNACERPQCGKQRAGVGAAVKTDSRESGGRRFWAPQEETGARGRVPYIPRRAGNREKGRHHGRVPLGTASFPSPGVFPTQ